MKALVIYSHTYPETSKAGNAILEVLKATPNFEVRNIDALYPDLNEIDIAAEQKALLEAEVIIFQHPIFWFNVPHSLKRWMDEVLQYGFAFGGAEGNKLRGKKFIHSFTTGFGEDTYAGELGQVLSAPILASANYCGMEYIKAFPLHNQFSPRNPNIVQEAKAHAEKLVAFVQSL
jgi:glutathione-regulated potassium-efflux system ancillary protein kefF